MHMKNTELKNAFEIVTIQRYYINKSSFVTYVQ